MTRKVAHLVYSFSAGGLERVIVNLINHSRQYDVEHVIITLTNSQAFSTLLDDRVRFYCINKKPGNDLGSHIRLFLCLRKIKPDILHTYNIGTLEYQVIAFLAGVKCLLHSEHGREENDPDGSNRVHNFMRRMLLPFLNYFVVVSNDLEQWAQEMINVNAKKLRLIYNGVKLPNISVQPHESYTYCTVGRLSNVKNQALLIDGFANALLQRPQMSKCKVLIVGNGPLLQGLQQHAEDRGVANNIYFLGFREDVDQILTVSDVFVLTSIYEAMPMSLLEAMALGLPAICPDVGGVSDVLKHGKTGWLFTSQNVNSLVSAMIAAFDDQVQANKLGSNALLDIKKKFSLEVMIEEYMVLYQALAKRQEQ